MSVPLSLPTVGYWVWGCCPILGKLTRTFAPWSNPPPPPHGIYIVRCITIVSFAAVFRLITQRSSPQTAAFFRTTFLSLCLSVQAIDQSYHNHCLNSNQSNCSKKTFPRITIWDVDQRKPVRSFYSSPKKVVEADRCLICSTVVAKKDHP